MAIRGDDRRIWLASGSPRRRDLLEQIGLEPLVITTDVPEENSEHEKAGAYAVRLAKDKGKAAREIVSAGGPAWMIAADTVVCLDDQILEKPRDNDHAVQMLQGLSGRDHFVVTAFWVGSVDGAHEHVDSVKTRVRFRCLAVDEVRRYVETGEPLDKAGAYGIQGIAGCFVEELEGSYSNVVGLPLTQVVSTLRSLGALEGFPFL